MKMKSELIYSWPVVLLLALTLHWTPSQAYYQYQQQIPNGNNVLHPCKANYRWQGVGHQNPMGGGTRNVFGLAFKDAGYQWTVALCRLDSDGDGRTNGEELGDPNCVWSVGQIPSRTTDITHPGVCEPIESAQCLGKTDFVNCEVEEFSDCERIQQPEVKNLTVRFPPTPVPNTETNYYCMNFDLPADQDYHLIASEPVIANRDVMHHILLFGCSGTSSEDQKVPAPCGMASSVDGRCSDLIAAWTVGSPGHCLTAGTGFRFGTSSYKSVKMQMHWNNPKLVNDYTDSSGLKLYYQPATPDINNLAMLMVGQRMLTIPPGQSRVEQNGSCSPGCSSFVLKKPAYVVSALNHMHYLGRSQKVELYRNGVRIAYLTNEEVYSYDSPVTHYHDPPIELLPGDDIRTTCVFNSLSSSRYVYFGEGTQDEMCLGFLTVYPADALRNLTQCVSIGPMSMCDMLLGKPVNGCNWKEFVDPTKPSTLSYLRRLTNSCSLTFCRPECKEIHDELSSHPCMQKELSDTIVYFLRKSEAGLKFLGLYHSCSNTEEEQDSQTCTREKCGC